MRATTTRATLAAEAAPVTTRAEFFEAVSAAGSIDFEDYVRPVNQAVAHVARRYRLSASDTDDLRSDLWLKLLAQQGRPLRAFSGRCRIETYLTRIARNLLLDQRDRILGKRRRPVWTAADAGAGTIPEDNGWTAMRYLRQFVGMESLDGLPSLRPSPLDTLCDARRAGEAARLRTALIGALKSLSPDDRRLLVQRYLERQTVAELAERMDGDASRLYRYFAKLLRTLRRQLMAAGIDRATVQGVLDSPGAPLADALRPAGRAEG